MKAICEDCVNYVYNYETDSYSCQAHLDEDDMWRFLNRHTDNCLYYRFDDEYSILKKQI